MVNIRLLPKDDGMNGWGHLLPARQPRPELVGPQHADWVVVGATPDFRKLNGRPLKHLLEQGYASAGNWNLAQTCDHLAYFMEASLDGFSFQVPWLIRYFLGGPMKRRILQTGRMPRVRSPQKVPAAEDLNESQTVQRFRTAIDRLQQPVSRLHDSPFFGPLTPDEWRRLHTIHAAHHFSFLIPKGASAEIAEQA